MSPTHRCALRAETRGEVFTVHFEGPDFALDAEHTEALAGELCGLAHDATRPDFLVDLRNVVALRTPALVLLVKLRRQLLADGRRLALCNVRPAVADVLETSTLNHLFPIRTDGLAVLPSAPATLPALVPADREGSLGVLPEASPEELVGAAVA